MTTNSNSEISMADLEEARTLILQVLSNDMYREVARTSRSELAALFAWVRLVPRLDGGTAQIGESCGNSREIDPGLRGAVLPVLAVRATR